MKILPVLFVHEFKEELTPELRRSVAAELFQSQKQDFIEHLHKLNRNSQNFITSFKINQRMIQHQF
jgi:hypothetical protein